MSPAEETAFPPDPEALEESLFPGEPEGFAPGQDGPDLVDMGYLSLPPEVQEALEAGPGRLAGAQSVTDLAPLWRLYAETWRVAAAHARHGTRVADAAARSAVFTECADALEAWLAGFLPDVRLVASWATYRGGKPRGVSRAAERLLAAAAELAPDGAERHSPGSAGAGAAPGTQNGLQDDPEPHKEDTP